MVHKDDVALVEMQDSMASDFYMKLHHFSSRRPKLTSLSGALEIVSEWTPGETSSETGTRVNSTLQADMLMFPRRGRQSLTKQKQKHNNTSKPFM